MRKYRDFGITKACIMILNEIFTDETSAGWSGSYQEVDDMKANLEPFNIHYSNDFTGEWSLKSYTKPVDESNPKKVVVVPVDEDEDDEGTELLGVTEITPNEEFETNNN